MTTLRTLYVYELKKLFFNRINVIVLIGATAMLALLAAQISISEQDNISKEATHALDGRVIDDALLDEMKQLMRYENGVTSLSLEEENNKYRVVYHTLVSITGVEYNLLELSASDYYEIRNNRIIERMKKQGLSESDIAFWVEKESQVQKPFVYYYHKGVSNILMAFQALGLFIMLASAVGLAGSFARESSDRMNQLLLCSRNGRNRLYGIKLLAGCTWIVVVSVLQAASICLPFMAIMGLDGLYRPIQLVRPWSMLPYSIGQMLAAFFILYFIAALLYAVCTMFLSLLTQNTLAATGAMIGYLLVDVFVEFPDKYRTLCTVWALRPNAVLMNTEISNYRLLLILRNLISRPNYVFKLLPAFEIVFSMRQAGY